MLREIRKLWKDGSPMLGVVERLAQMVADAEYVYVHAWEVCTGQAVIDKTDAPLRERDKAVNRGEREIRRLIASHLGINPGEDVSGCLAVMIMAKDVERLKGRHVAPVKEGLTRLNFRKDTSSGSAR